MPRETRLGKILSRLKAEIVDDVPPSLDACEACREVDCTEERWRTCPTRLALEAERLKELAARQSATLVAEAPGRAAPRPAAGRGNRKAPKSGTIRRRIGTAEE